MKAVTESLRLRRRREEWREGSLSVLLWLLVFAIFFSPPLVALGAAIGEILAIVVVLALVAAVLVASPSRKQATLALVSFVIYLAAFGFRIHEPSPLTYWLSALGSLSAIGAASWVVALTAYGPGQITKHRIRGAVVLYLNMGLGFSTIYRLIEELAPGSFSGLTPHAQLQERAADLLYFSIITLSTTGFGDIAPLSRIARSAASLEAVIGQLYIATFLGRLITLDTERVGKRHDG